MSDFFAQSAQRLYRFLGRLLSGVEDFFFIMQQVSDKKTLKALLYKVSELSKR